MAKKQAKKGGYNSGSPYTAKPKAEDIENIFDPSPNDGVLGQALSPIWNTTASAGRGVVDLIARGMFASAGAAEEAFAPKGGGVTAVPGRVASEVLSGVGGIQGKKKGFTQVMEDAGVGTLGKLSDIGLLPYHDGPDGWMRREGPLDFTGRGAVGFAADVLLDPTTYLTSGGSVARRFLTDKGVKYLSKAGVAKKAEIVGEESSKLLDKWIAESADPVFREEARRQARTALENRMEVEIQKNPKLLDKTGVKWFGQEIISQRVLKGLTSGAREVALSIPGGGKVAIMAKTASDSWAGAFDRWAAARGLDDTAKEPVINKIREYQNALANHSFLEAENWAPLEAEKLRLAAAYGKGDDGVQVLGRKFAEWRQGTGQPLLKPEELAHFKAVGEWLDERGVMLLKNGVITPEQWAKYNGKFIHQDYKNKEILTEVTEQAQNRGLSTPSRGVEERTFENYAEAERVSGELNRIGILDRERGGQTAVYGKLIPEYDYMKTSWQHVEQTNKKLWQGKLFEDIKKFGVEDLGYDPARTYSISEAIPVGAADRQVIEDYLQGNKTLSKLAESFEFDVKVARTPELRRAQAILGRVAEEPNRQLGRVQRAIERGLGSTLREMSRSLKLIGDAGEFALGLARRGEGAVTRQIGRGVNAEMRAAKRELAAVWDSLPIKYYEKKTLKSIDEVGYFRRRGWDVIQESDGGGKYSAYTTKEVTPREYASFSKRLETAKARIKAIEDRAAQEGARNTRRSIDTAKRILDRSDRLDAQQRVRIAKAIEKAESDLARAQARTVEDINRATERAQRYVEASSIRAERDVRVNYDGWDRAVSELKAALPKLSVDGQKELTRQLTSMAHSPSQILKIEEAVGDKLMPAIYKKKAGDIEPFFIRHGLSEEQAKLVPVEGGIWGEKKYLVPKAIVDLMDDMPRDFVADAAAKMHVKGALDAYDKYGNWFKGLTYPGYPSGAFRDIYNNLQHSFFALGIGGLARGGVALKIDRAGWTGPAKFMASNPDEVIRIGGMKRTTSQWNDLARQLRVPDPTASSFVQYTGERQAEKAGLLARARVVRGSVDNVTRIQLWVNGMSMGMTPEDAARMVHEFHYNYAELSHVDNYVFKRLFPFWVFPRKTISLYARQIPKTPGRFINLAKPFMGREDENRAMAKWEGEGFKIRLERDGKNLTMINGIDLPVRSIDMLWRGDTTKTLEGFVAAMSPAIKVPYEMMSSRDPFRGRPYGRGEVPTLGRLLWDKPGIGPIRDFLGLHRGVDAAGRVKYTARMDRVQPLMEGLLVSRLFSTSDRQFREQFREPNVAARYLDILTGLRKKTLNLEDEAAKKLYQERKDWLEEQVNQGKLEKFEKIYRRKGQ